MVPDFLEARLPAPMAGQIDALAWALKSPGGAFLARRIAGRRGLDRYHGETAIDFYGRRWWGLGASALLLLLSVGSLVWRGLNLSIDFEGDTGPAVQYSHARICSILRKAAGAETTDESVDVAAVAAGVSADAAALALLGSEPGTLAGDAELGLLRTLAAFPETVDLAARQRAPHKLTTCA